MTKDEIIRKKQEYIFNCVTTYFKDPLVIDHAKGQYVWDLDGKQYLDFLGGIVTLGFECPTLMVTIPPRKSRYCFPSRSQTYWPLA